MPASLQIADRLLGKKLQKRVEILQRRLESSPSFRDTSSELWDESRSGKDNQRHKGCHGALQPQPSPNHQYMPLGDADGIVNNSVGQSGSGIPDCLLYGTSLFSESTVCPRSYGIISGSSGYTQLEVNCPSQCPNSIEQLNGSVEYEYDNDVTPFGTMRKIPTAMDIQMQHEYNPQDSDVCSIQSSAVLNLTIISKSYI